MIHSASSGVIGPRLSLSFKGSACGLCTAHCSQGFAPVTASPKRVPVYQPYIQSESPAPAPTTAHTPRTFQRAGTRSSAGAERQYEVRIWYLKCMQICAWLSRYGPKRYLDPSDVVLDINVIVLENMWPSNLSLLHEAPYFMDVTGPRDELGCWSDLA
jgi:hypothetical protein